MPLTLHGQRQNSQAMQHHIKKHSYSTRSYCLSISLAALLFVFILTACTSDNGSRTFGSSAEAAKAYHDYLSDVKQKDNLSIEELSEEINHWRSLSDSVLICLRRDTVYKPHANYAGYCRLVHDSIRGEMIRLDLSKPRTLRDVVYLKEHTSPYADNEELLAMAKPIQTLFASLDSMPAYPGDKNKVLSNYQHFLSTTLENGIQSREDMLAFFREEDRYFRTFLSHLHELGSSDMTGITKDTERCCLAVFQSKDIPKEEATLYMTLRTFRRLIQNAKTCLDDIQEGKVSRNDNQAQAYTWMLLQPYSSIDALGIALLSDTDKATLYKLAEATPKAIGQLYGTADEDDCLEALPELLIKILIIAL